MIMKKLIFILGIVLIGVAAFGQRAPTQRTISVPAGTHDTTAVLFSTPNPWSVEFNASNLDGVDTMYVYAAAHSDSTTYSLIWVDQDLDGANDNPWTLSTSTNLLVWGESWPFIYIIYVLKKGTSTAGLSLYVDETRL